MIESIARNTDVVTGAEDLEPLYVFRDFPVFMGCTSAPRDSDIVSDMHFWISRGSGMIQLNPLLPLEVLYPESHGAGHVGTLWARHHQALSDFIARFDPQSVLEIGGGHGILATNYQRTRQVPWTILEPNPTPIDECNAQIIKGFFDERFVFPGQVDAVVHSHVFEHIYNPDLFVRHLAGFLPPGKRLIFSVPNMRAMLERKFTNCLNFEHTVYLSDDYVEYLLARHGFTVQEKEYFLDDHSIFYSAMRDDATQPIPLSPVRYAENRKLYLDYAGFHERLVGDINRKLAEEDTGRVFLFGAHVQAQYLIGFGLDMQRVEMILDNDTHKHGKRLYGTDKRAASPSVLAGLDAPVVIIRAGTFTNEVMTQIRQINSTTRFIL